MNEESTLGDRVRERRNALGLSQVELARLAGMKQSDISKIERGQIKKTTGIIELARALNCTPEYLGSGVTFSELYAPPREARVPVISWDQATSWVAGGSANLPPRGEISIPAYDMLGGFAFALTINGDSMTSIAMSGPTFPEGTVIVVDPAASAQAGDFVLATDPATQRATFKQLVTDGGRWYLKALNPSYPTIGIEDPAKTVIGKVVRYQYQGRL